MMLSVKGIFEDGTARPSEPVDGREGQAVIITFLGEEAPPSVTLDQAEGWQALEQLVENSAVETGISDLAEQHDHYLYGSPKQT